MTSLKLYLASRSWLLVYLCLGLLTLAVSSPGHGGDSSTAATVAGRRTQHLAYLGADRWHAAGVRGKGVKVAILDTGFRGYRDHLGRSLPEHVTARSFRDDDDMEAKDSQHGILCGEVVHALAPDAELLFANWESEKPETFVAAAAWAREKGARVISCSVIMPSWSDGEGGGDVHRQLRRIVGEDVLCFASAGNTAQRHWSGPFHDGGAGYHEWRPGHVENRLSPWGNERVSVELYAPPGARYELSVRDVTAAMDAGPCLTPQRAEQWCAVVQFQPEDGHTYQVRVRHTAGKASPFHLVALGAGLDVAAAPGSIPFPGDGAEVIAVGAVDTDGRRMAYSSCGPNSTQPKPDLVAPVPFASSWRERPFSGTSAAAPQAAALAALYWSRQPGWTANQVRKALCGSARDLGAPGHDFETGYGLIHLPAVRVMAADAKRR